MARRTPASAAARARFELRLSWACSRWFSAAVATTADRIPITISTPATTTSATPLSSRRRSVIRERLADSARNMSVLQALRRVRIEEVPCREAVRVRRDGAHDHRAGRVTGVDGGGDGDPLVVLGAGARGGRA